MLGAGLAACASNPTDPRVRSTLSGPAFPSGTRLPPGVSRVERFNYYDVAGETAVDLWRQMRERGPMAQGHGYVGRTDWNMGWTYNVDRRAGWCRPRDVRVALTVTTILPAYTPADSTSELARDWATFIEALRSHERGHRDIAVQGAAEVQRAIRDVHTSICTTLGQEINQRAKAAIARVRERNDAYDQETRHGVRQGTRWPPRPIAPAAPRADSIPPPAGTGVSQRRDTRPVPGSGQGW